MITLVTTKWFGPNIKPVYIGYYQRRYNLRSWMDDLDYWDGHHWRVGHTEDSMGMVVSSDRHWRGLAENPWNNAINLAFAPAILAAAQEGE